MEPLVRRPARRVSLAPRYGDDSSTPPGAPRAWRVPGGPSRRAPRPLVEKHGRQSGGVLWGRVGRSQREPEVKRRHIGAIWLFPGAAWIDRPEASRGSAAQERRGSLRHAGAVRVNRANSSNAPVARWCLSVAWHELDVDEMKSTRCRSARPRQEPQLQGHPPNPAAFLTWKRLTGAFSCRSR